MELGEETQRIKFDTDIYEMLASFWLFPHTYLPKQFYEIQNQICNQLKTDKVCILRAVCSPQKTCSLFILNFNPSSDMKSPYGLF